MTLEVIKNQFTKGGTGLTDGALSSVLKELQGLNVSVVAGAAANTAMNLAAIRLEDTIIRAVASTDASAAAIADDTANITIQSTAAFGTLTFSGTPLDGETFVVNDKTYTLKTAPTDGAHVKINTGANAAAYLDMSTRAAAAINAWETRRLAGIGVTGNNPPGVVATNALGVVTITSVIDGVGNAPVVTGTVTVLAATGSGTASATLTPVTVVAANTAVINGVTFTASATPTGAVQFYTKAAAPAFPGVAAATAGSDCATGQWLAKLINAYENANSTLDVVATAHATTGVVTIVPKSPKSGNIITLTEGATNVAATGSGTLTGGTATGSIKSTTNLTGKTLTLYWFNKR